MSHVVGDPGQPEQPAQNSPQQQVVYVEKKKKGGCLKWGALIIGALILLSLISSLVGKDSDKEADRETASAQSDAPVGAATTSEAAPKTDSKSSKKEAAAPFAIGETFTTKKKLDVVVNSFEATASPLAGDPMSCAAVTYTNNGDKAVDFQGYWDWKAQNPAGVITNPTYGGEGSLSNGQLAPGGTVSGNVCFDGSDPGEYLLNFDPQLSLSADKASWKATL